MARFRSVIEKERQDKFLALWATMNNPNPEVINLLIEAGAQENEKLKGTNIIGGLVRN